MLPGRFALAACSMHFRASCKNAFSGRLNGWPIITALSPSATVHTLGAHAVPSASATARAGVAASCLPSDSAAEFPAELCCGGGCSLTADAPMAWQQTSSACAAQVVPTSDSPGVVALDVEYIPFVPSIAPRKEFRVLGEVAVVDIKGDQIYHSYCHPGWLPRLSGLLDTLCIYSGFYHTAIQMRTRRIAMLLLSFSWACK